jgi:hypothetical protein
MDELNQFELAILNKIADEYSILKIHIPFLIVKSREATGVGIYVHFSYKGQPNNIVLIDPGGYFALSSMDTLEMEGLKYGLAYEISITDGLIDFLELVTYGEDWDGTIRNFCFKDG